MVGPVGHDGDLDTAEVSLDRAAILLGHGNQAGGPSPCPHLRRARAQRVGEEMETRRSRVLHRRALVGKLVLDVLLAEHDGHA